VQRFYSIMMRTMKLSAIDPLIVSKEDSEECFRIVNGVLARINELIGS